MANVYQENGFNNRREYLEDLADNMGMDSSVVFMLADLLGPNEDFDGLVTSLEDYEMMGY
jgi:cyclopropane fatty-acyl-phospholipid synthase-like methyltransferase